MGIVTATVSQNTGPEQLTRGDGGFVGVSAAEPAGFHGVAAAQLSGGAQTTVTRGQAMGIVSTYASSLSPTSLAAAITTEASLTVLVSPPNGIPAIAANDLLYINKPTAQAGLGYGNVRVSAANVVALQLTTYGNASITPTASEKYGIVAIRGLQNTTVTLTPGAVAASTTAEQQFNVTGLRASEVVKVIKPTLTSQVSIVGERVVSAGVLGITFANVTATAVTPPAEQYTVYSFGGLDALNNEVVIGATYTTPGVAVTAAIVAEQSVTITGLATTDMIKSVSKPTINGGISIAQARVSAANVAAFAFSNPTASTITPTAAEIYAMTIERPAPLAPLIVYNQTVTPTSVAANTTAEQSLTVTGLVSGSIVYVNKPSATPGLGIAGVRVSAANVLGITYCNATAAAITPPSETYLVANFQMPIPDAGNVWVQSASPQAQQMAQLTNAMRTAMVSKGMIAGA